MEGAVLLMDSLGMRELYAKLSFVNNVIVVLFFCEHFNGFS